MEVGPFSPEPLSDTGSPSGPLSPEPLSGTGSPSCPNTLARCLIAPTDLGHDHVRPDDLPPWFRARQERQHLRSMRVSVGRRK